MARESFFAALGRHRDAFARVDALAEQAEALLRLAVAALESGGKIVFFGNGGSAADAQHLAAEFMVRYRRERGPLAALSLTTDSSILTAHSNDYAFESVFERQVQGLVGPSDLVIGLTTSGTSENVNRALRAAGEMGAATAVLTGRDGGQARMIAELAIVVPSDETARIQEVHMFIGHWLCEAIDERMAEAGA